MEAMVSEFSLKKDRMGEQPEPVEDAVEPESGVTGTQLPIPTGYKLLIALPEVADTHESGIAKAEQTKRLEEVGSMVGFVVSMGADAYKDESKFPNGPYCEQGDFVLMRSYSGSRFSVYGKEFRLINDDSVEAVVDDPRGIARV